jgi:hypothetical protein
MATKKIEETPGDLYRAAAEGLGSDADAKSRDFESRTMEVQGF